MKTMSLCKPQADNVFQAHKKTKSMIFGNFSRKNADGLQGSFDFCRGILSQNSAMSAQTHLRSSLLRIL